MILLRNNLIRRLIIIFSSFVSLLFFYTFFDLYSDRYIPPDVKIHDNELYDYTGSIHIHTKYSDGSGTPEEIAKVANQLGIDFLIISDHDTLGALIDNKEGYYNNVLVLTGVEISSEIGHYLVYSPSPDFRLYDIKNSLYQLKNNKSTEYYSEMCHPFHPKTPIKNWNYDGFDAVEIFNGDSQWRDDTLFEIFETFLGSFLYKNPLNKLVDRPEKNIEKWSELIKGRKIFQIGSADAHANIKVSTSFSIKFPSYEQTLRFVKTHILTEEKLSGAADRDKIIVFDCLKKGRCYTEIGNFSRTSGFIFKGENDYKIAHIGDDIEGKVKFSVFVPDTTNIVIKLYNNNEVIHSSDYYKLEYTTSEPGAYWVEVFQVRRKLPFFEKIERPWIISNPIFVLKNLSQ